MHWREGQTSRQQVALRPDSLGETAPYAGRGGRGEDGVGDQPARAVMAASEAKGHTHSAPPRPELQHQPRNASVSARSCPRPLVFPSDPRGAPDLRLWGGLVAGATHSFNTARGQFRPRGTLEPGEVPPSQESCAVEAAGNRLKPSRPPGCAFGAGQFLRVYQRNTWSAPAPEDQHRQHLRTLPPTGCATPVSVSPPAHRVDGDRGGQFRLCAASRASSCCQNSTDQDVHSRLPSPFLNSSSLPSFLTTDFFH